MGHQPSLNRAEKRTQQLHQNGELQLQHLQHLQHLQLFADLHLQHFWQNVAYMPGLWHKIAVP
jgi:hypothetical protein